MLVASNIFTESVKSRARDIKFYLVIDNVLYDNTKILNININNKVGYEHTLIGNVITSKLEAEIISYVDIPVGTQIGTYMYLVITWITANVTWDDMDTSWDSAGTEHLGLGVFYVDTKEYDKNIYKLVAYDKLLETASPYISSLTFPATMDSVLDEICNILGVVRDPYLYIIFAGIDSYNNDFTINQMLSYIASYNCCNVRISPSEELNFHNLWADYGLSEDITFDNYVNLKLYNKTKRITKVKVYYNDTNSYQYGYGTPENTLEVYNPYGTFLMAYTLFTLLEGLELVGFDMDYFGFGYVTPGDFLYTETSEYKSWESLDVTWDNVTYKWDLSKIIKLYLLERTLSYSGGIKETAKAEVTSASESEYQFKGDLSSQSGSSGGSTPTDAVIQDTSYAGVEIGQSTGLIGTKSNDKVKVSINETDGIKIETASTAGNYTKNKLTFDANNRITLDSAIRLRKDYTEDIIIDMDIGTGIEGGYLTLGNNINATYGVVLATSVIPLFGNLVGGVLALYNYDPINPQARTTIGVEDTNDNGVIRLKNSNDRLRVEITANDYVEGAIRIGDSNGFLRTSLGPYSGYIDNQDILTDTGVNGTFTSLDGKTVTVTKGVITSIV